MAVQFFGQYLVDQGHITHNGLEQALALQSRHNRNLGDLAVDQGLMTSGQVLEVHEKQKHEDLLFGEMAVKLNILSHEQVDELLALQRQNHLYIGQALVRLRLLGQTQLDALLRQFNAEQEAQLSSGITIPPELPHAELWQIVIDMTGKMLTRLAGIPFHAEQPILITQQRNPLCATATLTGRTEAFIHMAVTEKTRTLVGLAIFNTDNEEDFSAEILNSAFIQFVNLVCGNVVNKAFEIDTELEMIPAEHLREAQPLSATAEEFNLLIPIHLPHDHLIELIISAKK